MAAGDAEPAADGKAAVGGAAGDDEPATGGTAGDDEPATGGTAVDDAAVDEPPVAATDPPLRSRGDEPVWVIDGRPRYHLDSCGFLHGREPESVPLRQAVEDGFTPCALCDPDSGLVAAAANRD